MGLDAVVYCDCYEKGRLLEPPPAGSVLSVEPNGALGRAETGGTLESALEWDCWYESRACEHQGGILIEHRLGNIALIGLLRTELERASEQFPILVTKVVYSGSHAGDFLPAEDIPALQKELDALSAFRCSNAQADRFMVEFRNQMSELAMVARLVGKPIAF